MFISHLSYQEVEGIGVVLFKANKSARLAAVQVTTLNISKDNWGHFQLSFPGSRYIFILDCGDQNRYVKASQDVVLTLTK